MTKGWQRDKFVFLLSFDLLLSSICYPFAINLRSHPSAIRSEFSALAVSARRLFLFFPWAHHFSSLSFVRGLKKGKGVIRGGGLMRG